MKSLGQCATIVSSTEQGDRVPNLTMNTIDRDLETNILYDDKTKEDVNDEVYWRYRDEYNGYHIMCNKLMRHPILSQEEEQSLLRQTQNGASDEQKLEARNRLILHNQRLVFNVAKKYSYKGCLTVEDLIQEGTIGLVRAIEHFDLSKENKFATYAIWWVRQAITRAIEETGDIIRKPSYVAELDKRLQVTIRQLKEFTGTEPTYEEIAEASGMSVAKVKEVLLSMQVTGSLDKSLYDDSDVETILNRVPDDRPGAADIVSERIFNEQLEELITSSLGDKGAEVIKHRFGLFNVDEETLATMGKRLGLSRERIRQIEREVLSKIRGMANRVDDATEDIDHLAQALLKLSKANSFTHCMVCGKKLSPQHWKYCSEECRQEVVSKCASLEHQECAICGSPVPLRRRKYCNDDCKRNAAALRERERYWQRKEQAQVDQLLLFDLSSRTTSEPEPKVNRRRAGNIPVEEKQLTLWNLH